MIHPTLEEIHNRVTYKIYCVEDNGRFTGHYSFFYKDSDNTWTSEIVHSKSQAYDIARKSAIRHIESL